MVYEKHKINGVNILIDRFLRMKLDIVLKLQKKDFDVMFLIDGQEGTGKSTLSFLCAWYLSKGKISMFNICEGSSDAAAKLEKLPDESVMIIDEGSLIFSSKDTMRQEQRQLIKILNVIRQKRMILIVVAPSFFELQKYISIDRSKFLLHVYTEKKTYRRGRFVYFSEKKKRMLFTIGKKNFNSYARPKGDFVGTYPDFKLPFDDEYMKLKRRSLLEALHDNKKEFVVTPAIKKAIQKEIALKLKEVHSFSNTQIGEIFGHSEHYVRLLLGK